jgi:arylformamidase
MRVLDLTWPLDAHTPVYDDGDGYHDPTFEVETWATVEQQGYSVHRLEMGTHTGTHLDAPAHFHPGQRTVDQIPPVALVGPAVVIDTRQTIRVTSSALAPFADRVRQGGLPLFVNPEGGVVLDDVAVATVVSWRPNLILYSGQFIDENGRYYHNRVWLGADIPLVTDLDPEAVDQVKDGDLIVVAPLRLVGLEGAPCRVLALQGLV